MPKKTPLSVRKRDGKIQSWDRDKIERAIVKAFDESDQEAPDIAALAKEVERRIRSTNGAEHRIELIQDAVEQVLMEDHPEVAQIYIRYRVQRDSVRSTRLTLEDRAISDYIHAAKYAANNGSEPFSDTVDRVRDMHIRKYPKLKRDIVSAFELVREKKIRPSSRSLQFGGVPIEKKNARLYNCATTHINRLRVFGEVFYMLLCGCGVGYSVQYQHVERLPEVSRIDTKRVKHYTVADSIEGWADSINELIKAYFVTGEYIEFVFHEIRPEGSPLSSGGLAPGHIALKKALSNVRDVLDSASGRKLRPIEAHDIICFMAEAVLSGGIRRSALAAMFSAEDSEMIYCKAHGHFRPATNYDPGVNPQRQMANNSAMLLRSKIDKTVFNRLIRVSKEWGDPGFVFTDSTEFLFNPCYEAAQWPTLSRYSTIEKGVKPTPDKTLEFDPSVSYNSEELTDTEAIEVYGSRHSWQACNLTEINVAAVESTDELVELSEAASLIGTLQAGYTDFPYLGPVAEKIVRREALLGVGLTGIMDNPDIGLNPLALSAAAKAAIRENERVAKLIGINPAARVTVVKPAGTSSLALGNVSSGIHYPHARRYFRRVTANPNESVAKHFLETNPHMVEHKPNGDLALVFPILTPDGAKTVKDENALDFVEHVLTVYENWVRPGSATRRNKLPLTHNVSATVSLRDDEWDRVIKLVWDNRDRITAMSFLPITGDKIYPFAPREEVITEADEAKWNYLISNYKPVDYSTMKGDPRNLGLEPTCSGGVCEM